MNWAEEKFVKLFTRDTPTWLCWPWQARALAPLLMRKLEGEGRLAIGRIQPSRAIACTVGLPEEVVDIGLKAMLEDGTLELRENGLWWPEFEEAQESRKSEALRLREYRAKQRHKKAPRTNSYEPVQTQTPAKDKELKRTSSENEENQELQEKTHNLPPKVHVAEIACLQLLETSRAPRASPYEPVQTRTNLQLSRPDQTRTDQNKKKEPAAHAPRESDALCADFLELVGKKYAWQGAKDGAAFARLRKEFSFEEIRERWRKGLQASGWQQVRTVAQLLSKWNDLAGDLDTGKADWLKKRNSEQNEVHIEGEVRL